MPKRHVKVLLIEDNPGDVRLIWEILSEIRNPPFYLNVAETLLKGLDAMEKEAADVILLDLTLPDSSGIYTLNRVKDKAGDIPVVVITGLDDEVTAIKSLKEGAQDYLVKGRTDSDLLKKALIYAIERNNMIAELEANEKKLRDMDRIKTGFVSKVMHEVLIPVNTIKGAADKLASGGAGSGPEKKYIDSIKNNIDRLYSLLDDLIDVTKMETGSFTIEKKECDASDALLIAQSSTAVPAEEKNIGILNEARKGAVKGILDCKRMGQALTNLILNSINSSKEGAKITIGVKTAGNIGGAVLKKIKETGIAGERAVVFYVSDNGEGISPEDKGKIFDRYFEEKGISAKKYKNIGLGLEITKNIVSNHGGIMWVESGGKNRGCTFYMLLPGK